MRAMLALLLSTLALTWGSPAAQAQDAYKVGAIFSITGPGSSLGIPERDTALMLEATSTPRAGSRGPTASSTR